MKIVCYTKLLIAISLFSSSCVEAHSKARDQINHIFSVEKPVINTATKKIHHDSSFDFTFFLRDEDRQIKLVLEPNHNILAKDAHIEYLDSEGKVRHSETIDRQAYKVFKGSAWVEEYAGHWERAGWARVYVKQDGVTPLLEGAFSIWGDQHHIQLQSSYIQTKRDLDFGIATSKEERMIVYRDSDMAPAEEWKRQTTPASRCPADELTFNTGPNNPIFAEPEAALTWDSASVGSILNRQIIPGGNSGNVNLRGSIGSTEGCPDSARVALIGIATDCSYTASFDNVNAVRDSLIAMVNTASDVYERTFNVTLGLQNLTISDAACPASASDSAPWNVACSQDTDIQDQLQLFSSWRGDRNDGNAFWSLMSSCRAGSTVGIAWLGQLCVSRVQGYGGQSVTGANVIIRTPGEWQVFAHETAHTFGAVHDCDESACSVGQTSQCCPASASGCDAGGRYLMNPTSMRSMTEFSPCTVGNICSALGSNRVRSRCLIDNVNVPTINGAQCGNGVVEAGEQCDCGSEAECGSNSCCDPTTCQFRNGAVCDDANEACCSSCQFASAGTVCRASKGQCDVAEMCSGSSGSCPTDAYQPNGRNCGNETDLFCAEGQCTSRDLQCQLVVIQGTSSNYTSACDQDSCRLRCSQSTNSQFCAAMNRNLLDGTPCDGGLCNNGVCSSGGSSGGSGDSVSSWVDRNRSLVIGLAAGLGSLVLLLLACSIWCCCRKSRKNKVMAPIPPQRPMGHQFYGVPPPYPTPAYSSFMARQNNPPLVRYA